MHTMDWKVLTILNIVLCVTARPPRAATSEQKFIKYFSDNEEKINVGSENTEHREEYVGSYPSYEFSYKVSDPHTHDFKGQEEKRHGDKVNGVYWLTEPDGRKRLVKYHANDDIGFNVLIDYSQKGEKVQNEESGKSETNNNKEEKKKRVWHVIHDYKMKKNSKENAANEENNASQSNENAESGSIEMNNKQSISKSKEQVTESSRSNQENEEASIQEQNQENNENNSNESDNAEQAVTSQENSKKESSSEKKHLQYTPHKYLKKDYAVIEEINEGNVEDNDNGNESEAGVTEDTSINENGAASNEENNETNVEQNSAQRESGENSKKKERAYGYKTYIYHIRH